MPSKFCTKVLKASRKSPRPPKQNCVNIHEACDPRRRRSGGACRGHRNTNAFTHTRISPGNFLGRAPRNALPGRTTPPPEGLDQAS
eukprot:856397-Pyramimonas_sp.AAC.1